MWKTLYGVFLKMTRFQDLVGVLFLEAIDQKKWDSFDIFRLGRIYFPTPPQGPLYTERSHNTFVKKDHIFM